MKTQLIQCPNCNSTNVEMLKYEEQFEDSTIFVGFKCHEIKCKKFFVNVYFEGKKGYVNDSN